MKIYALRDRLLDYFNTPFFTPGDKEAFNAVATAINQGDPNTSLAKTPNHFELWELGEIDDQGNITVKRSFLADAAGFVRERVRPEPRPDPTGGTRKGPEAHTERQEPTSLNQHHTSANQRNPP